MKKFFYTILLIFLATVCKAQVFVQQASSHFNRLSTDTLYNLTGCDTPHTTPNSYKRVVWYYDSCHHVNWYWKPEAQTWTTFTNGTLLNGTGYIYQSGLIPTYVSQIPNADLVNSSITINSTPVSLGGSISVGSIQSVTGNIVDNTDPDNPVVNGISQSKLDDSTAAIRADFPTGAQPQLNGIGFVKASGTTISYDNSTYLTTNQSIAWTASGDVSGSASGTTSISPSLTVTGLKGAALPSLASGLLKYTGSAWAFDNNNYITTETDPLSVHITDSAAMLAPYLRKVDTFSLSNRINLKVNISDTAAMLSPYLRSNVAAATYQLKGNYLTTETDPFSVHITDSSAMLSPYLRSNIAAATYEVLSNKSTSTSLGTSNTLYPSQNAVKTYVDNGLALKLNIADSAAMLSPYLLSNVAAATYVPLSRTVNGKALSSNITLGLASSDFANQGTTTTVLHGNASGNPSFGQVGLTTDVTGVLPAANGGFVQGDTVVYLSKSSGVVSDADISIGSSTFGTNNTTPIQNVLNIAQTHRLKVIWDVDVSGTQWKLYSNTRIEVLPERGAIQRNASNKPFFINADTAFGREPIDSNISIIGGYWNGNAPGQTAIGTPQNGATVAFAFYGVKNMIMRDFTIVYQKSYGIHCLNVRNGLVENGIINCVDISGTYFTDGLHFDGYSNNCIGRNLRIRSFDDAITTTADDLYRSTLYGGGVLGTYYFNAAGPINNIRYENIYLDSCRFGYRATSGGSRIDNIVVSNLTGNTIGYSAVIDNFQSSPDSLTVTGVGNIGTITIENDQVNVYANSPVNHSALININCNADNILLKDLKRNYFYANSIPTVYVSGSATRIKCLTIDGYDCYDTSAFTTNHIFNAGIINSLNISRVNVKRRGTSNASNLFVNNTSSTVKYLNLNNIIADSINGIYFNSGNAMTVNAVNIIHKANSASFTTSSLDTLTLSNYVGTTKTSGTFGVTTGDAYPGGYWQLSTTTLSPLLTTYNLAIGNNPTPINAFSIKGTNGAMAIEHTSSNQATDIWLLNNTGSNGTHIYKLGSAYAAPHGILAASDFAIENIAVGNISIMNSNTAGQVRFSARGSSTAAIAIDSNNVTNLNTSVQYAYVAKIASYTATASDNTINFTSGTDTLTLPTAVNITGRRYTIVNSGSGTCKINTTSSQTFANINSTPIILTLNPVGAAAITSYTVMSNGANWIVIGKVKDE